MSPDGLDAESGLRVPCDVCGDEVNRHRAQSVAWASVTFCTRTCLNRWLNHQGQIR